MALTFHLKYNAVVTIKRACIVLFLIWIASIGYGSSLLFSGRLHRDLNFFIFTSCLVVNSVAYFVIYRIVRRHHLQIQSQAQILAQPRNGNLNMKNYRKSVLSMLVIFCLFLICYAPYLFYQSVHTLCTLEPHPGRFSFKIISCNSLFQLLPKPSDLLLAYAWALQGDEKFP